MIAPKEKSFHKNIEDIFVYSMIMAGISVLIMAILHSNHFLFMVGVFSLYMTIQKKGVFQVRVLVGLIIQ
jgi:hypothetical protein